MEHIANEQVDTYAKPAKCLAKILHYKSEWFQTEKTRRTACQEFINILIIPLTFLLACFVGLSMFIFGLVLFFGGLMILSCLAVCIVCYKEWSDTVEGAKLITLLIFGGLGVIIYAMLLLAVWPVLLIVFGVRAFYDHCCSAIVELGENDQLIA